MTKTSDKPKYTVLAIEDARQRLVEARPFFAGKVGGAMIEAHILGATIIEFIGTGDQAEARWWNHIDLWFADRIATDRVEAPLPEPRDGSYLVLLNGTVVNGAEHDSVLGGFIVAGGEIVHIFAAMVTSLLRRGPVSGLNAFRISHSLCSGQYQVVRLISDGNHPARPAFETVIHKSGKRRHRPMDLNEARAITQGACCILSGVLRQRSLEVYALENGDVIEFERIGRKEEARRYDSLDPWHVEHHGKLAQEHEE
jgi:hypothetical protein